MTQSDMLQRLSAASVSGRFDFFVKFGNIQNPVPASQYFDPKIYLDTIKG